MTVHRSFDKRGEQGRPRADGSKSGRAVPEGRTGGSNPDRPARPGGSNPGRPAPTGGRIEQVRQVLDEVVTWQFAADSVVSHWLRAHPAMGVRDRGEVAEAVYDILRHLRRYRQFAESGVGPATRRLAILGLWSTLGRERIAAALDAGEQAWLERVLQIDSDSLSLPVRASIPDWLYDRVRDLPDVESLLTALNQPASLDIRVNPMKADRDEMLADLIRGNGVRWSPVATPYSPWGIRLRGRPAMNKWHQFEHGLIEVQDEGSQLLALLVAPRRGEMVIDFCAGAGGKTLLLGALMRSTGRLYAFDVSATRLARAKPRFARSGLSNINPVAIEHENDARVRRLAGKAQRVLVDAPCSGIGTLRRNPDLKWRQNQQSLAELTALQARILASAARCVAPGGRLVYATCSILPEENEAQVERFLSSHPDFELVDAAPILAARTPLQIEGPYLKLRPDVHGTDGFFAAVFDRVRKDAARSDRADAGTQSHAGAEAADAPVMVQLADAPTGHDADAEAAPLVSPDVVVVADGADAADITRPDRDGPLVHGSSEVADTTEPSPAAKRKASKATKEPRAPKEPKEAKAPKAEKSAKTAGTTLKPEAFTSDSEPSEPEAPRPPRVSARKPREPGKPRKARVTPRAPRATRLTKAEKPGGSEE